MLVHTREFDKAKVMKFDSVIMLESRSSRLFTQSHHLNSARCFLFHKSTAIRVDTDRKASHKSSIWHVLPYKHSLQYFDYLPGLSFRPGWSLRPLLGVTTGGVVSQASLPTKTDEILMGRSLLKFTYLCSWYSHALDAIPGIEYGSTFRCNQIVTTILQIHQSRVAVL